ncbi:MAG: flavodoxin family protein [Candidatus Electrothrix sp. AX1]|nr:flavodoxin family protein [Candidatus Electrothrix sp. AX1]
MSLINIGFGKGQFFTLSHQSVGSVVRRNGFMLKNKLGGVIAVGGSRNGGQELTVQAVHAAMMIHDMIIVGDGDHFGGAGWANHPDGYEADTTGIASARNLGIRMGEVATTLRG